MEGQRLVLADLTIIEGGHGGADGNYLWLRIPNWTMAQVAGKFCDPSATQRVVFQYGEMEEVFEGFTDCVILMKDGEEIAVSLMKG